VGQLRPEKQQSDLLEAASRLIAEGQDIVVMIVGGGPQLQNLRTTAVRLGIADRVVFRGELADVRPALAAFDVFALTSVAVETFSNAALEAMAAGLPVVISEIGGAAEMIRPAVDGFLYPAGDTAVLADILSTLAADKTQRDRLGAEAVRRVALAFSFEAMIDRYEELFRDPS
jgi:glycosyltransferase involved in cell wall biosynthesis